MSRTRHHGAKAKLRLFEKTEWGVYLPDARRNRPKLKRNHAGWHWMGTPSWWIREMMTKPQRAETRQLLHRVMREENSEELMWPLPKKPHIYYW